MNALFSANWKARTVSFPMTNHQAGDNHPQTIFGNPSHEPARAIAATPGWLRKDLTARFEGRILPVELEIADACGRLIARSEFLGPP